jgi:hypothetical protein
MLPDGGGVRGGAEVSDKSKIDAAAEQVRKMIALASPSVQLRVRQWGPDGRPVAFVMGMLSEPKQDEDPWWAGALDLMGTGADAEMALLDLLDLRDKIRDDMKRQNEERRKLIDEERARVDALDRAIDGE